MMCGETPQAPSLRKRRMAWTTVLRPRNMGVPMMLGPAAGKLRGELAPLANFCAQLRSARVPLS